MSRLSDALMGSANAYHKQTLAPMLNLGRGGQHGFAPNLSEIVNAQAYIRQNIICLVLAAPTDFTLLDGGEYYVSALKSLCELHAVSIEGLARGLEVETQETDVGGGGEKLEHATNVTRARSQVTFRWQEKYGMPVEAFLSMWIRQLIMDPDSKVASINTTTNRPTDRLLDRYSATMAFIEPDPSWTKVQKSWIGTNMFPKSTGEVVGSRDLVSGKEETMYDVQFAGVYQSGVAVDQMCQSLLEKFVLTNADPYRRATFVTGMDANMAAVSGIQNQVANMGSTAASV